MQHRKKPVCIYVDNSNIYIGGQEAAKNRQEDSMQFRINFSHFLYLVTGGDLEFEELVWAGSGPHDIEDIFESMTKRGIDLHIIPRSETGEHETVDEAIQLCMYRHHRKYRNSPGTIVLCTGDGKGYHEEKGFLYDVTGFIEDGWDLALYSWDANCHHQLKDFAIKHGHYVKLEDHYESITFIKSGRNAKPVELHPARKQRKPAAQRSKGLATGGSNKPAM
ncbi:MAG: hypothetical protein V4616_06030 [Bacteroidota bacterium]